MAIENKQKCRNNGNELFNVSREHNRNCYTSKLSKFLAYLAIFCVISHHAAMALTIVNRADARKYILKGRARYNPTLLAAAQSNLIDNDKEKHTTAESSVTTINRRSMIRQFTSTFLVSAATYSLLQPLPPTTNAAELPKSYSSNARNIDRLSSGDSSGGSTYDNYPKTERAARRRAMEGCKVDSARKEANVRDLRECNLRVMDGDTEFMLDALRALDCPTCPYGIKGA